MNAATLIGAMQICISHTKEKCKGCPFDGNQPDCVELMLKEAIARLREIEVRNGISEIHCAGGFSDLAGK